MFEPLYVSVLFFVNKLKGQSSISGSRFCIWTEETAFSVLHIVDHRANRTKPALTVQLGRRRGEDQPVRRIRSISLS